MCYYISITPKMTDLEVRFSAKFLHPDSFQQVYSASAFSYPLIPVISDNNPEYIDYFRWGLIPFWTKDTISAKKTRQRTLNARAETIFQKPAFRHSVRSKRCLILADGFFEWRHGNGKKYPYYITLKGHSSFAIAGIWDAWLDTDTGETTRSCAVITTAANSLLEVIHNTRKRMPVILKKEGERQWLVKDLDEQSVMSMLASYNDAEMEAYPVASIVTKLGFNTKNAEVLKEYSYKELPSLPDTSR